MCVRLRLFGLLKPWFDKTWKPGDIELVKSPSALTSTRGLRANVPWRKNTFLNQCLPMDDSMADVDFEFSDRGSPNLVVVHCPNGIQQRTIYASVPLRSIWHRLLFVHPT
jgi:hypothetical protein